MKTQCPICIDEGKVKEKVVEIPVGRESFRAKTLVCDACGHHALTPKVRKEMEEWGKNLKKNVIEPQPLFTGTTHAFLLTSTQYRASS